MPQAREARTRSAGGVGHLEESIGWPPAGRGASRCAKRPAALPYYSDWRGSFEKLPWATDEAAIREAGADVAIVGAPLDDGVSSRPGARFGPRAIRMAPTTWGYPYAWSIQLDVEPYSHVK